MCACVCVRVWAICLCLFTGYFSQRLIKSSVSANIVSPFCSKCWIVVLNFHLLLNQSPCNDSCDYFLLEQFDSQTFSLQQKPLCWGPQLYPWQSNRLHLNYQLNIRHQLFVLSGSILSSYLFDNRLVYRLFANYSPYWKIVKFLFTAICLWKSKIFGLNRDYISERASKKSIKNSICKKYYCQNIQNFNEKLDKSKI